jgi:hypothetical protein
VEKTLEPGSSVARVGMKHGVRVADEREVPRQEPVATPLPSSGSIHIELSDRVRISLEGHVDAAMVRAVLKILRL